LPCFRFIVCGMKTGYIPEKVIIHLPWQASTWIVEPFLAICCKNQPLNALHHCCWLLNLEFTGARINCWTLLSIMVAQSLNLRKFCPLHLQQSSVSQAQFWLENHCPRTTSDTQQSILKHFEDFLKRPGS
jgi:hypothetical protein